MSTTDHPHISFRFYVGVFLALMVLLAATVVVAFVDFGLNWLNVAIAMGIAVTKATLVVLYFMHVRYATRLTQIFVVAAFLWLGILFVLTASDYLSRGWLPMSSGWPAQPRVEGPLVPEP